MLFSLILNCLKNKNSYKISLLCIIHLKIANYTFNIIVEYITRRSIAMRGILILH